MLQTGGALTAALLPHRVAFGAEQAGPVIRELSSYMAHAKDRALPANVIEKAKHHILGKTKIEEHNRIRGRGLLQELPRNESGEVQRCEEMLA